MSQPNFMAELKAMAREGIKDVRATLHEAYFGKAEHMPEMGTPLNPTPQLTTQELGVLGSYDRTLDAYSQDAKSKQQQISMER